MSNFNGEPAETEPLEYFQLGRKIQQRLAACSQSASGKEPGDIFYLWIRLAPAAETDEITRDQCLNIIDEAASLGVNWLVLTLETGAASRDFVGPVLRWAQQTHGMVIGLHVPGGDLLPAERELLRELPRESCYLLVEPGHASSFDDLRAEGVNVGRASPTVPEAGKSCEYPCKMIYVDATGRLYTCGLVSGDQEFFLGSVFEGGLDQIIHNPTLPHSVLTTQQVTKHKNCSGCPPLVSQYLCQK